MAAEFDEVCEFREVECVGSLSKIIIDTIRDTLSLVSDVAVRKAREKPRLSADVSQWSLIVSIMLLDGDSTLLAVIKGGMAAFV